MIIQLLITGTMLLFLGIIFIKCDPRDYATVWLEQLEGKYNKWWLRGITCVVIGGILWLLGILLLLWSYLV